MLGTRKGGQKHQVPQPSSMSFTSPSGRHEGCHFFVFKTAKNAFFVFSSYKIWNVQIFLLSLPAH